MNQTYNVMTEIEKSTQSTKSSLEKKRKAKTLGFENPGNHGELAVPSAEKSSFTKISLQHQV